MEFRKSVPALLAVLFLGAAATAHARPVTTGGGTATVTQNLDGAPHQYVTKDVSLVAALAENITEPGSVVLRFQFVRPDSKGVGFLVWSIPAYQPLEGMFVRGQDGVGVLYYEQTSGNPGEKLFLSDEWEGTMTVRTETLGSGNVLASFSIELRDFGPDHAGHTPDDRVRTIENASVVLFAQGDLSGVEYYESDGEVYVYEETVIVYDEGCSGGPDDYDDDYGYDGGDSDDDWESGGCDGDTWDDDDDWDDSGWDDSDWDGDDYDWEDDDDSEWDGDDYEYQVKTMSWTAGLNRLLHDARRPLRLAPLLLGLLVVLMLKRRTRKRNSG